MKAVVTLVLAVAVFALPLGASAQYYPGGYAPAYSQACAPQPVCPPAYPANCYEQSCFSPLAPVGMVVGGVGSLISGIGNAIGGLFTTCGTPCY
jgi:hypothetical protein